MPPVDRDEVWKFVLGKRDFFFSPIKDFYGMGRKIDYVRPSIGAGEELFPVLRTWDNCRNYRAID